MSEQPQIFEAMNSIMKDVEFIGKESRNDAQQFNYRGIDEIYNNLHKLLADYKVFTVPRVTHSEYTEGTTKNGGVIHFARLTVDYTFFAADGSHVVATVQGEGMDSGDKASNKAMAVAHKYALLQCFCIPTAESKDPDAESHTIGKATRKEKAFFDSLMASEDSLGLFSLWEALKDKYAEDEMYIAVQTDLHNSGPKGKKTEHKEKGTRLRKAGQELYTLLIDAIDREDNFGIAEAVEAISDPGKRYLMVILERDQQEAIKSAMEAINESD